MSLFSAFCSDSEWLRFPNPGFWFWFFVGELHKHLYCFKYHLKCNYFDPYSVTWIKNIFQICLSVRQDRMHKADSDPKPLTDGYSLGSLLKINTLERKICDLHENDGTSESHVSHFVRFLDKLTWKSFPRLNPHMNLKQWHLRPPFTRNTSLILCTAPPSRRCIYLHSLWWA